jgi:hypothetical protein
VKSILDKTEQLDALTTSLELEKAELRAHAAPFYFTHWHGQHAIASSVDCRDPQGRSKVENGSRAFIPWFVEVFD